MQSQNMKNGVLQHNKFKVLSLVFLLVMVVGSLNTQNFTFQLEKVNAGDAVLLGPVSFSSPASDLYQYIDARHSITYGTTTTDPPSGMGVDDTSYTTLTEGSYTSTSYTQLEYAGFGSSPSGWTFSDFTVSGGVCYSTADGAELTTKNYDLTSYSGARLTFSHDWFDHEYEASDWEIWYYTGGSYVKAADVDAAGTTWKTQTIDVTYYSGSTFKFLLRDMGADANENIAVDNWYIYGITENTYYRFEAVFRFDTVNTTPTSFMFYLDFYSALTGLDKLDFYIGATSNPTTQIAVDEVDDFSVDVTDYITSATMYLRITDEPYREGDTVQTLAYIQRCYLFSLEITESVPGPTFDNDISNQSITSFSETLGSNVALDPDSDTNGDFSKSEWGTAESIADDVFYYPDGDFPTIVLASAGSYSGAGATGDYTNTHAVDASYYYAYTTTTASEVYIYLNFTVPTNMQNLVSIGVNIYGFCHTDVEGYAPTTRDILAWNGTSWVDIGDLAADISVPYSTSGWTNATVATSYVTDGKIMVAIHVQRGAYKEYVNIDYAEVVFNSPITLSANSYAESFSDVSDWTSISGIAMTSNGDLGIKPHNGDAAYYYEQADTPSILGGCYVETRFRVNVSGGNSGYRVYVATGDGYTGSTTRVINVAATTTWQTTKVYCAQAVESIRFGWAINIVAQLEIDYIRIGPADEMGWQHDGSTTAGVDNNANPYYTYYTSTDGDILNMTSKRIDATAASPAADFYIYYDTTATKTDLSIIYYPMLEVNYKAINYGALYVYAGGKLIYQPLTVDSQWHTLRLNIAAGSGTAFAYLRFQTDYTYTLNHVNSILLNYTKFYAMQNWTYVSSLTNNLPTAVVYYDDAEDAMVLSKTVDTSTDYVRIKTENITIGYAVTDMVIGVTVKAAANTTCRIQLSATDGAVNTYKYYYVYDDWMTIWMPMDVGESYPSLDYFEILVYDWADATPSSGSFTLYVKDNITIRPSWYDASAETGTYDESFAGASDWALYANEGADAKSSDGDVLSWTCENNGNPNSDYIYTNTPSLVAGSYYVEFRYRMNTTAGPGIILIAKTGSDFPAGSDLSISTPTRTTTWTTVKVRITATATIESIYVYTSFTTHTGFILYIDYIRIAPADEMGYQDDMSSITPYYQDTTSFTDGDVTKFTGTSADYSFTRWMLPYLKQTDYPLVEIRWKAEITQSISFGAYDENDVLYQESLVETGDWTITRLNLDALVSTGTYFKEFRFGDGRDNIQEFWIDYIKFYSIANYSITQGASTPVTNIAYVDSTDLILSFTSSQYMTLAHDPALSVTTLTYNVVDASITKSGTTDLTGFNWEETVDGAAKWILVDETRAAMSRGTLTDMQISIDVSGTWTLSAINFICDATAPTIAATSYSPSVPTDTTGLTLFAIATDVVGVEDVWFDAIAFPDGFSDIAYHATEVGTNTWTYSFSTLTDGVYCFAIYASDLVYQTAASYSQYLMIQVSRGQITCYIRIFDSLGDWVPFETFEVWKDGARQYTDTFSSYSDTQHDILVKDRWGETLNYTTFPAGTEEFVIVVDVYSLKFMSYYTDFCYFNLTRNGHTYTEVIAPLEIVNFKLFNGTYDYGINFRNGSGWCVSGSINLINSTAIIITGSGVSDLLGLISGTYALSSGLNVSVTTIASDTYTIQLMFDWTNTTLYGQTINILASFNWDNTTLYNQTIALANAFNATNTVLYNQIILLQNMFNWQNTTLFNQTISILNAFNATNTVLYGQTVSILSNISYYGSTIYGQAVDLLNFLYYDSSSVYNQTIDILTQLNLIGSNVTINYLSLASSLTAIDSNLLSNFTSVSATLLALDSNLYSNFTSISSELLLIDSNLFSNFTSIMASIISTNSTIYAQTISILSYAIDTNQAVNLVLDPSTFNILFGDFSFSDDFAHFWGMSNWHNATITIYENDVAITSPISELSVPILYAMSASPGTYNVSAKFVSGSHIAWYNTSYTIAQVIAFKLSEWQVDLQLGGQQPYVNFYVLTSWENATIFVYDNGTLMLTTTESQGGISSYFWMSQSVGTHNLVFNVTNGVTTVTKTISYYVPDWAVQGLAFTYALSNYQDNGTSIFVRSNWGNCTFYFYLNGTLKAATGDDPGQAYFTRPTNVGTWNLTIVCNGESQISTIKNIYFTVTEQGTTYINGGHTDVYYYNYDQSSGDSYDNPPGFFIDQGTAAIIVIGAIPLALVAYLAGREFQRGQKIKTERKFQT